MTVCYSLSFAILASLTKPLLGLLASPRRIFGANYDRLTELKAKFDPDNVFDKSYSLYVGDSGLI